MPSCFGCLMNILNYARVAEVMTADLEDLLCFAMCPPQPRFLLGQEYQANDGLEPPVHLLQGLHKLASCQKLLPFQKQLELGCQLLQA